MPVIDLFGPERPLVGIAGEYHEAGWHPFPLPARAKKSPPTGRTGGDGVNMTIKEIEATTWAGNIGLRMADDVIGVDVDGYKGGCETLANLEAELGSLPPTVMSHSGRGDGPPDAPVRLGSGIRFYRVPPKMAWVQALDGGIEIIQEHHRYSLAPPSIHPDGRRYELFDQAEDAPVDGIPLVEDLPPLPWSWIEYLSRADANEAASGARSQAASGDEVIEFIERHTAAEMPGYISEITAAFVEKTKRGRSRHSTMQASLIWALEHVRAGIASAEPTLKLLADRWVVAVADDPRRAQVHSERKPTEFQSMVRHAVGKVNAKTQDEIHVIHDSHVLVGWSPPALEPTAEGPANEPAEPERTSWYPVDLTDALAGRGVPPPLFLHRSDGLPLLYPGRLHWFQGESESGKSWAAQLAVAEVLKDGGHALYIDFEDDETGLVERLLALAVSPEAIVERFVYLRPDEPLYDARNNATSGAADLAGVLDGRTFAVAIIDGVTEAMTTEGLALLDNTDIARWLRRLPKRLCARGAAVVCIDHVTKARDDRGRYALGGGHKLNGLTGAAYSFVGLRPFGRAKRDSITGTTAIEVKKDRPGFVRGACPSERVGILTLTSWPDGGVTGHIVAPEARIEFDMPSLDLVGRIIEHLTIYEGASKNAIETSITAKGTAVRTALVWMACDEQKLIEVKQAGQAHRHYLTDAGRAWGKAEP